MRRLRMITHHKNTHLLLPEHALQGLCEDASHCDVWWVRLVLTELGGNGRSAQDKR